MAIQIPNPGTGNGETGDNEFVLWNKVKDNFSNQSHAASRLVGTAAGSLLESGVNGVARMWDRRSITDGGKPLSLVGSGLSLSLEGGDLGSPIGSTSIYSALNMFPFNASTGTPAFHRFALRDTKAYLQQSSSDNQTWNKTVELYTTGNTTKDSNGFLKAASPIIKVFADKVELNYDAADQNVTYKKNDIGDYTITTVSGLSTDGWYIELPKDMNGNPKVAVTLTETDGVISLKTYKRIFSMDTFTFTPDLNEPLDIPDDRWIDLRLNEIPINDSDTLDEPVMPDSEV